MTKSYSKIHRILHWLIALVFILLLITIFLRMTWMNKHNVAEILQRSLGDGGNDMDYKDWVTLAKVIREPMWQWHAILGYILIGLFAIRFTLPFFGDMKVQNPLDKKVKNSVKFQRWVYILFYGLTIVTLITGLVLEFAEKTIPFRPEMKSFHKFSLYYLLGYIALHLVSVIHADFTDQKGIISRMVSGKGKRNKINDESH